MEAEQTYDKLTSKEEQTAQNEIIKARHTEYKAARA